MVRSWATSSYEVMKVAGLKKAFLPLDGSRAMEADLSMGTHKITDLVDPTADQQAETKKHVSDTYVPLSQKGAANGVCPLTAGSKISDSYFASVIRSYHILPNMMHRSSAALWRYFYTPLNRYDDTLNEDAEFSFILPTDIDLTTNPVLRIHVMPYDAQTVGSDFKFTALMKYIANTEDVGKADDEAPTTTITVSNTAKIKASGDITLDASKMAAGDLVAMRVKRNATDGADDRNGDAAVMEVEFRYTSNKMGG